MSLANYDGLKTEIASYIARSDVTSASETVDTFIDLAEAYIKKRLRTIRMQKDEVLTASTTENYIDLPSDFLEIFSLEHTSGSKDIQYKPRSAFKLLDGGENVGRPRYFTLAWDDTSSLHRIKFIVTPDSDYTFNLVYYATIPALSSSQSQNWLLMDYPEIYLNACLYFAFKRYRSPIAADYKALLDADIDALNMEDEKIHTGGGGLVQRISGTVL